MSAPQGARQMGKIIVALACVAVVVLALPVRANDKPTEAFQKAMKEVSAAYQAVRAASKEIEDSGAGGQDYVAGSSSRRADLATGDEGVVRENAGVATRSSAE